MTPENILTQLIYAVKNPEFADGATFDDDGIHLTPPALTALLKWAWNPNNRTGLGGMLLILQL
jgi:hypothetical protein